VTWFQAISGGFEAVLVIGIMLATDWKKCADEARARQESSPAATTSTEEEGGGDGEEGDEETANLLSE